MSSDEVRANYESWGEAARSRWHPTAPLAMWFQHDRERHLYRLLRAHGWVERLPGADILDIGCGEGDQLNRWVALGARPDRLHGIDLTPGRIERGRLRHPQLELVEGDASRLPFSDRSFDLVTQFVAFSAMPPEIWPTVAAEMRRVLRPGGAVVWYDIRPHAGFTNRIGKPGWPDLRALSMSTVRDLFRPTAVVGGLLGAFHPVAELARFSPAIPTLAARLVPPLRSHLLLLTLD